MSRANCGNRVIGAAPALGRAWLWLGALCFVLVVSPSLARGPASVADVAEGLQDAVVNISTTQTLKGPEGEGVPGRKGPKGSPFEEFFDDFFDEERFQRDKFKAAVGKK